MAADPANAPEEMSTANVSNSPAIAVVRRFMVNPFFAGRACARFEEDVLGWGAIPPIAVTRLTLQLSIYQITVRFSPTG